MSDPGDRRRRPVIAGIPQISERHDTLQARVATQVEEEREDPTQSFWFGIGKSTAPVFEQREDWLFRRVESIEFLGRKSVRRSVSVDFEIPKHLPDLKERAAPETKLIPISVFQKWPPLMGFDLIDPQGHSASLYRRTTNKELDYGLLLGMIELLLNGNSHRVGAAAHDSVLSRSAMALLNHRWTKAAQLSRDLQDDLEAVLFADRPARERIEDIAHRLKRELDKALKVRLEAQASNDQHELALRIARRVDLASQLAASSILWVPVQGVPGTDRIVKFSYLDRYGSGQPEQNDDGAERRKTRRAPLRRLLTACSWRDRSVSIVLPHAGRHTRFHLDVHAPHGGIELLAARAVALAPADADEREPKVRSLNALARRYPEVFASDEFVGPQSSLSFLDYEDSPEVLADSASRGDPDNARGPREGAAQIVDRRAHVYLGPRSSPSHRVVLQLKLAATRHGLVLGCLIAAAAIAALMSIAFAFLHAAALHLEPTVVLLSAVPVVLGYVLVRPGEQALERYHIAGVRTMALLTGATPILGALTLLLTQNGQTVGTSSDFKLARPIWGGLLIASWLLLAGLACSWLFAASPYDERRRPGRLPTGFKSAVVVATGVVTGSLLDIQPYSRVRRGALAGYLLHHRGLVLAATAAFAIGAVALYTFIARVWHELSEQSERQRRSERQRQVVQLSVIGSGVLLIWGVLAALALVAWQTLTVGVHSDATKLASFARAVDATANASLAAALIFVFATSGWLAARLSRRQWAPFISMAGVLTSGLLIARSASLLWPSAVHVAPQVAWIAFGAWVAFIGVALYTVERPTR
jgi:hypothetical protein